MKHFWAYTVISALLLAESSNLIFSNAAQAQSITAAPDGTGTVVAPTDNTYNITGGTQTGGNLFHSFQQFGLKTGEAANFVATPAIPNIPIQNILGRVTGGNPSVINGLIQVTGGTANLYLMNPAGIVFGTNASLNVPASFTATTASAIGFRPGLSGYPDYWFNASGPNAYAQLVGTPTTFAFTNPVAGSVVNAGNLAVAPDKRLTLLGGTVVNTGTLTGGKVVITEVVGEKLVRVQTGGSLLSLDLPLIVQNSVNPLPYTPQTLPQLLTGGEASNASQIKVVDGVVHLSGSGVVVETAPRLSQP
jgi:filamentous hemagglutinin family protein